MKLQCSCSAKYAFDVTPVAGLTIFIDGGDPIGRPGDSLNLNAVTSSLFQAGPAADKGGFDIDATPTTSYDHLEGVTVTSIAPGGTPDNNLIAIVAGTNGDDDLTAQGVAAGTVDVTVNGGPTVRYIGVADLTLQGQNGDDDIDIDIQVENLKVAFTADGGLPSVTGDELTVTGVNNDAPDNVNWTPNPVSTEDGTLTVNGETIHAVALESVLYDGEGDHDNLSVLGGGRFVHTPGSAIDSGTLALGSLLAIGYVNLGATGTVTADGTSGGDTLVSLASSGSDTVDITFTNDNNLDLDLSDAHGKHVKLRTIAVENYEVRTLSGNDVINLNATFNVTGLFTVYADDPGGAGSDSFNFTDVGATAVGITPSVTNSNLQLVSGVFTNGYFHVTVTCQAGFVYVLQGSTNLTSWASLSTNSNTTGTFTFTDTTTPALQQRFYRTQRQ